MNNYRWIRKIIIIVLAIALCINGAIAVQFIRLNNSYMPYINIHVPTMQIATMIMLEVVIVVSLLLNIRHYKQRYFDSGLQRHTFKTFKQHFKILSYRQKCNCYTALQLKLQCCLMSIAVILATIIVLVVLSQLYVPIHLSSYCTEVREFVRLPIYDFLLESKEGFILVSLMVVIGGATCMCYYNLSLQLKYVRRLFQQQYFNRKD